MSTPITASMLYNFVQCSHRVIMDLFADPALKDKVSPFVERLWERGSLYEKEVIEGLSLPFPDLSRYAGEEKEQQTLEAMNRNVATKAPVHTILCNGCLGNPDPRSRRTSASAALPKSSIRAAATRSARVSKSQTMTEARRNG
jgi:hypothetical protein